MFQYFLKVTGVFHPRSAQVQTALCLTRPYPSSQVVSTRFQFLDGRELNTHQYSVTQYERDCALCDRLAEMRSLVDP